MLDRWLWGLFFISVLATAGISLYRHRNFKTLAAAAAIGSAVPLLIVIRDCRADRVSEACVWGQALLPFYLGAALLFAVPALYLLLTLAILAWRRLRHSPHTD